MYGLSSKFLGTRYLQKVTQNYKQNKTKQNLYLAISPPREEQKVF